MSYKTLFLILLVVFFSCDNSVSDNTNEENEVSNDVYYVKYEVNSSTIRAGGKLDVTISRENDNSSTIQINQKQLWEMIIGPVSNGFNATMSVNAVGNTFNGLSLQSAIYVSKNNSPFALKKIDGSQEARDNVTISYTIDY